MGARASGEAGETVADFIGKVPIQVGLQTDSGYPHKGVLDYVSPEVNQSTGTLLVRGAFENDKRQLLPGYFVRVRVPLYPEQSLLVPEVAMGSDQAGRYVLVVKPTASSSSAGCSSGRPSARCALSKAASSPTSAWSSPGILEAVPGQKVDPQLQTPKAAAAEPAGSQ